MQRPRPASADSRRRPTASGLFDSSRPPAEFLHPGSPHVHPSFHVVPIVLEKRPQSAGFQFVSHVRSPRKVSTVPDAYPNLFISGQSLRKQLEQQQLELLARLKMLEDENQSLKRRMQLLNDTSDVYRIQADNLALQANTPSAEMTDLENENQELWEQLASEREKARALKEKAEQYGTAQELPTTAKATVTNALNEVTHPLNPAHNSHALPPST